MATIRFASRVYPVRKLFRVDFTEPSTPQELALQQRLDEAHIHFFHRRYVKALEQYKSIWWLIHTMARPDLPKLDYGSSFDYDIVPRPEYFELIVACLKDLLEIVDPEVLIPVVGPWPSGPQPDPAPWVRLGVSSGAVLAHDIETQRAQLRPHLADPETVESATRGYVALARRANLAGNDRLVADTYLELGAALAAVAQRMPEASAMEPVAREMHKEAMRLDHAMAGVEMLKRPERIRDEAGPQALLKIAALASSVAAKRFEGLGDELHQGVALLNLAEAMDAVKPRSGKDARAKARELLPTGLSVKVATGVNVPVSELVSDERTVRSASAVRSFYCTNRGWELAILPEERADLDQQARTYTVYRHNFQATAFRVDENMAARFKAELYEPRVSATALDQLDLHEEVVTNIVAYIPHLYFYVLPIAIGDCHVELGSYAKAVYEYAKAEIYPYLNHGIEAELLWLKKASVYQRWGDFHFRQEETAQARTQYQRVLTQDYHIPTASPLYAPAVYATVRTSADAIAQALREKTPIPAANSDVVALIGKAYIQLYKLNNGLNFLGFAPAWYPVLRFKYLQSVARYMTEHAIQAERAYLNFLDTAERSEFQRLQLENALDADNKSLEIEKKRVDDAHLEQQISEITRQHTELRHQHAIDALNEWDTKGRELASVNAALAWASNAANDQDITYTGVQYRGTSHDFDTDVEEFYDVVGEWKEQLTWELQRSRMVRERNEFALEVDAARLRGQQAATRVEIAELSRDLARIRRNGTRELLDFVEDRILSEDVWYRLANAMRDLSTDYLNMAIEAAFYMQRAYALEMDRELDVIRFDYQSNDLNGLLAGDFLLRDIDRFTADFLNYARKRNAMRQVVSLSAEYPYGFAFFKETGLLPFRTTLEYFDRRYQGTFGRKIRKLEIFVEGLVPSEGIHGYLEQTGVSKEWTLGNGGWAQATRVLASERLMLSSYQHRRDITVFQPSQELLEIFENSGLETSWTLGIPLSSNDIDLDAITDIKIAFYFDALYDASLASHVAALYPNTGEATVLISARFQFPDEYFAFDRTRSLTFTLHPSRFPYNRTDRELVGLSLRLLPKAGVSPTDHTLQVSRLSDNAVVNVTTDANGAVLDAPGSPFAAWAGGPAEDTFVVSLPEDAGPLEPGQVDDIQIGVRYTFRYRSDA